MCAQNAGIASGNAKNSENIGNAHLIGGKCTHHDPPMMQLQHSECHTHFGKRAEGEGAQFTVSQ